MSVSSLIYCIGCVYLAIKAFHLLRIIYAHFQNLTKVLQKYQPKDPQRKRAYALITGSTDGIGKGNAIVLAREGFNIIQISRNATKLENVKKELLSENPTIDVKNICQDMSKADYATIEREIQGLDISLLVNNVGVGEGGHFEDLTDSQLNRLIEMNIKATVKMSQIVIKQFLKTSLGAYRLGIVNLSSMCGTIPQGYGSIYSASKAFDDFFSRSLSQEYSNTQPIDVLSLRSLLVDTPAINEGSSSENKLSKFGAITPIQSAQGALKWLGLARYSNGHISHSLQSFMVYNFIPSWLFDPIFANQSKTFYGIANVERAKKQ